MSVLHGKLSGGYRLLEGPVTHELEGLDREQTPERLVHDVLREALQKMRRLALDEVQRALAEAEPYVQRLPPTPSGRALLCAVALRKAHVALLQGNNDQAEAELQRVLSADPDYTLDQAQEPPTLLELFQRVKEARAQAPMTQLRVVTTPTGALVVIAGVPRGAAPLEVVVPSARATTLWAVRDGYQPRNVTVALDPSAKPGMLSVQVQLDPVPAMQKVRPLVDALRHSPPAVRPEVAHTLTRLLLVDTIILAQAGVGDRPQLVAYGAPPGPQLSLLPAPRAFDLVVDTPPPVPGRPRLPTWAAGLIGVGLGALTAGVVTGVAVHYSK